MSHELRTPLNAIIGFSDLMMNATPGAFTKPDYFEYTDDIRQSGHHLLKIVNDILDLSKVEAGQSELDEAPVDIPDLVRTTIRILSGQADKADLTVSTLFADNLPFLLADELKLKQILINLLANAIKFTPSGGMITISAENTADTEVLIKVSDTGIGIAPEDIDKVLAPFEQVDSSLSRRYDGTGLGLPLAASFVELHGGSLKIVSDVGAGTTVEIRFPAARALLTEAWAADKGLSPDQAMRG
jgi:signal transduction histidine kinase